MNEGVWNWLGAYLQDLRENDLGDIADQFINFCYHVADEEVAAAEAVSPQLLAFAQEQRNIQFEAVVRHLRLHALMNDYADPRPLMSEALDLMAFAHRDDMRDFPLRTCLAEGLDTLYDMMDGPGFAEERLQMLEEQLDGVSLQSSCYSCMTCSKIDTLLSLGRPDEALQNWETALERSSEVRESANEWGTKYRRGGTKNPPYAVIRTFIGAGKYEDALTLIEMREAKTPYNRNLDTLMKARVLGHLFQAEEATKLVRKALDADIEDIDAEALSELLDLSENNFLFSDDEPLAEKFMRISFYRSEKGRMREAFNMAAHAFRRSRTEGSPEYTKQALERMEETVAHLHRPAGANETLAWARDQRR